MGRAKDGWGRAVIIAKSIPLIASYEGMPITVRQLYYRLVDAGLPNTLKHYKRVVAAMGAARWAGHVDWDAFVDYERTMWGSTLSKIKYLEDEIEAGKVTLWKDIYEYHLNPWSNQPYYAEVWVEKKALLGVFEKPCRGMGVALGPCKGYPSLTFLNESRERFEEASDRNQEVIILYFGDYDPSGVDVPRSIYDNLVRMKNYYPLEVEVIALHPKQIREMNLPIKAVKKKDSRAAGWEGGVVELDAVEPRTLREMCSRAIGEYFDVGLYNDLMAQEAIARVIYTKAMKDYVGDLLTTDDGED